MRDHVSTDEAGAAHVAGVDEFVDAPDPADAMTVDELAWGREVSRILRRNAIANVGEDGDVDAEFHRLLREWSKEQFG